jgi:hypothetical protein
MFWAVARDVGRLLGVFFVSFLAWMAVKESGDASYVRGKMYSATRGVFVSAVLRIRRRIRNAMLERWPDRVKKDMCVSQIERETLEAFARRDGRGSGRWMWFARRVNKSAGQQPFPAGRPA